MFVGFELVVVFFLGFEEVLNGFMLVFVGKCFYGDVDNLVF